MRSTKNWKDFELLDTSRGERLERWGNVMLIRPDPQVIWNTPRSPQWETANARYIRSSSGGGAWETRSLPEGKWGVAYEDMRFYVGPTGFKHMGLFPEQAVNWDWMRGVLAAAGRPARVLNLFAYTGGATLACAAAGAEVVHVDASKGMVSWARENAALSGMADKPIRWIVDDCQGFARREIRRGNTYDAILLDPPSYGRGPGGEVWKLETAVYELVELCEQLLSKNALFLLLNSYTTGHSAAAAAYLLGVLVRDRRGGEISAGEIGLSVTASGYTLPCGSTAIWQG